MVRRIGRRCIRPWRALLPIGMVVHDYPHRGWVSGLLFALGLAQSYRSWRCCSRDARRGLAGAIVVGALRLRRPVHEPRSICVRRYAASTRRTRHGDAVRRQFAPIDRFFAPPMLRLLTFAVDGDCALVRSVRGLLRTMALRGSVFFRSSRCSPPCAPAAYRFESSQRGAESRAPAAIRRMRAQRPHRDRHARRGGSLCRTNTFVATGLLVVGGLVNSVVCRLRARSRSSRPLRFVCAGDAIVLAFGCRGGRRRRVLAPRGSRCRAGTGVRTQYYRHGAGLGGDGVAFIGGPRLEARSRSSRSRPPTSHRRLSSTRFRTLSRGARCWSILWSPFRSPTS